jgi:hypothetical protein
MPMRALGLVASAMEVARGHLPDAQVQFVQTIHAARRINGLRPCETAVEAGKFRRYGRVLIAARYPGLAEQATFLVDSGKTPDIDEEHIAVAIKAIPPEMQERLQASARRRKGEGTHLAYIAAHLQMHDTPADIHVPVRGEPTPAQPARIISLGGQSERPLYEARMACRAQGVEVPDILEATGQLFTKHVLPPYFQCRQQNEAVIMPPDEFDALPLRHPVPSVVRDLQYLRQIMRGEV